MARLLAAASTEYFSSSSYTGLPTAAPFTLACWAKFTTLVDFECVLSISDGSATNFARLLIDSAGTLYMTCYDGGASSATKGTISAGSWFHLAGVVAGVSSRTAYLNGSAGTTATASVTPASLAHLYVGYQVDASLYPMNGAIAEAGVWNVALTGDEIAQLAAGYSPCMVRPSALVGYFPMYGRLSATREENWAGASVLVPSGVAPTVVDGPRILWPRHRRVIFPAAAAAATGTLKSAIGVARSSIKTINGIAIASVKTYDALTP